MILANNAAVGVYDTGLGGLTAVRGIVKILPNEDIIYFGDTGRVPYGNRSYETIKKYSRQAIRFLRTHNVKIILVACGTVSSVAIEDLRTAFPDIPIIGVVEASCKKAIEIADNTGNKKIGVIATAATVSRGAYPKYIAEYKNNKDNKSYEVISKACPLFVPLVENGYVARDNKIIRLVAEEYLAELKKENLSSLIMGCTHYPMIAEVIDDIINEEKDNNITGSVKTVLIDSGYESAHELKNKIQSRDIANDKKRKGSLEVYVSDETVNFAKMASDFLGFDINKNITKIDIDKY